jgi:hypothetical protein
LYAWQARIEQIQLELARREIEGEAELRRQEQAERMRRHLATARRIGDIAERKLDSRKFAGKVNQPRDVLAFAKTSIQLEREICGDTQPRQEKPYVNNNILVQVQTDVAAKRREWTEAVIKEHRRCLDIGMSPQDAAASAHAVLEFLSGMPLVQPLKVVSHDGHPLIAALPDDPPPPEPVSEPEIVPPSPPNEDDPPTTPQPPKGSAAKKFNFSSTLPPKDQR